LISTPANSSDIYGLPQNGRLIFPTVEGTSDPTSFLSMLTSVLTRGCIGAVGEAAFMTGLERNSDIVFAASYAPLLNVSALIYLMWCIAMPDD
jgi:alpha-N-arabinofuranosidase